MQINRWTGTYNLSNRTVGPRYIVVHYVGGGTSKPGSAKANCQYFAGDNRKASADYFIDDGGIWQYNPDVDRYYTWAVGDGGGKYGISNYNSISIEVCIGGDNPYTSIEIGYLTELVQYLMQRYNVPADRVVRHWDASRKNCPYYYAVRPSEWNKLHAIITKGDWLDMATMEDVQNAVWNMNLNGVLARDRLIGIDIAANASLAELNRDEDASGRGKNAKVPDRLAWMAAKQEQEMDLLKELVEGQNKVIELLEKLV